ncbi:succinyl-diaminopimelate desuccinylase [Kitasatospora sp. NPDC050543]|uniref:succinyl-diaminopimelate desuccinylase n=1 Tax=Kitasatospora sp. NPDC050543 TaxID=3364054 RepID=UPI0037B9BD32
MTSTPEPAGTAGAPATVPDAPNAPDVPDPTDATDATSGVITATDPLTLTRHLVATESVSGNERLLADLVEQRLRLRAPHLKIHRIGNNVVARTEAGAAQRVLLAGHLDTVPLAPDAAHPLRRATADEVHGLGAVDMKGGIALMLLLAEEAHRSRSDCTFVFYDQEEVGSRRSGMNTLFADHRELMAGDFAVVLEPTGGLLEAGCQGNLVLELEFSGARAHTARPWRGQNAIHLATESLGRLVAFQPQPQLIDGLSYRQAFSVVKVEGGVQGNVVPDRCVIRVNYRHAPGTSTEQATAEITALAPEASAVRTLLSSPPARPELGHPLLRRLRDPAGLAVRPKLGWTDVGRFAGHGIPAVNFGPGDPELAHSPYEVVDRASLEACRRALHGFLGLGRERLPGLSAGLAPELSHGLSHGLSRPADSTPEDVVQP